MVGGPSDEADRYRMGRPLTRLSSPMTCDPQDERKSKLSPPEPLAAAKRFCLNVVPVEF